MGRAGVEVEHLPTGAHGEAEALHDRRGADPAAAWGGRDHVALAVDRVQVSGVPHVGVAQAEVADFAGADSEGAAVVLGDRDRCVLRYAVADVAGAQVHRCRLADQVATACGVRVGQQDVHGDVIELGVAVVCLPVGEGELGGLGQGVEIVGGVVAEPAQVVALQDGELL